MVSIYFKFYTTDKFQPQEIHVLNYTFSSPCFYVGWKYLFFLAEIQKVLLKLSKEKGCEIIGRWQKACVRHFYWSITSTEEKEGSENLKLAKFQAFLYHVINKHKDLQSTIFNACAHGDIVNPRVWMHKGTILNN